MITYTNKYEVERIENGFLFKIDTVAGTKKRFYRSVEELTDAMTLVVKNQEYGTNGEKKS